MYLKSLILKKHATLSSKLKRKKRNERSSRQYFNMQRRVLSFCAQKINSKRLMQEQAKINQAEVKETEEATKQAEINLAKSLAAHRELQQQSVALDKQIFGAKQAEMISRNTGSASEKQRSRCCAAKSSAV
jgi:hypothetical protein